jgi:hypothetical protein
MRAHDYNRDLVLILTLGALGALSGAAVVFAAALIWLRVFS